MRSKHLKPILLVKPLHTVIQGINDDCTGW